MRATAATKLNELSSRSHAVCIIVVEQSETVLLPSTWPPVAADATSDAGACVGRWVGRAGGREGEGY